MGELTREDGEFGVVLVHLGLRGGTAELFDRRGDLALQGNRARSGLGMNGGQIVRLAFDGGVTPVERFLPIKIPAQHRAIVEFSVDAVGGPSQ